jgi:hypothetical protein
VSSNRHEADSANDEQQNHDLESNEQQQQIPVAEERLGTEHKVDLHATTSVADRDGNGPGRAITRLSVKMLWVEICTRTHMDRNSYPYPYPSGFKWVSGNRQVCHFTCKNHIKIINLMSKTQYTHV